MTTRLGLGYGMGRRRRRGGLVLSGVSALIYEKSSPSLTIRNAQGRDYAVTINGEAWATGTATSNAHAVSAVVTAAMVAASAAVVLTVSGAAVSYTTECWGPSLLGAALLSQHDEQGAYADVAGTWTWAATAGGAGVDLQSAGASDPTTGTRNSRRCIVTNGSDQYLTRAFTRNQPTETWFAGRWTGAIGAGNKSLISGAANIGQIYRNATDTNLSTYAAGILTGATAALTDRWLVGAALHSGASSQVFDGGVSLVTGNAGSSAPAGLTIGAIGTGANYAAGEVGEVITTTGALNATQRSRIAGYLAAAWAI